MNRIGLDGRVADTECLRIGHVGCGSHSNRNLLPTYAHVPLKLIATCDLDLQRAQASASAAAGMAVRAWPTT